MSDLRPASDVEKPDAETAGIDPEILRQRKIGKAVRAQRAKRQALAKATGTDDGIASDDLAAKLEASAERARQESVKRFKAKQAVAAQLRKKGGAA